MAGPFGTDGELPAAALKIGAGQPFREIYTAAFKAGLYVVSAEDVVAVRCEAGGGAGRRHQPRRGRRWRMANGWWNRLHFSSSWAGH